MNNTFSFLFSEFLNVDDDDIAEDVDDMPCAEDTRLLENSGWSSRTRCVCFIWSLLGSMHAAISFYCKSVEFFAGLHVFPLKVVLTSL